MIKKLYRILIALYLLYLAIPLMISFFVQNQYNKVIHNLSQVDGVKVVSVMYNRGWYESKAIAELEISGKNSIFRDFIGKDLESPSVLHFTVLLDIDHGLIIKDQHNDNKRLFSIAKCYADIKYGAGYQGKIDDAEFWHGIQTVGKVSIDFDKTAAMNLIVESRDPVNIDLSDGNFVRWDNIAVNMYISSELDQFKGMVIVDEFAVKEDNHINVKELTLYFYNQKIATGSIFKQNKKKCLVK